MNFNNARINKIRISRLSRTHPLFAMLSLWWQNIKLSEVVRSVHKCSLVWHAYDGKSLCTRTTSRPRDHCQKRRHRSWASRIVLTSTKRKDGFHFLFILVFLRFFRNNFPRYTVRYDFHKKFNILMKFPNGSIVFRNADTRKFVANSWYYEPAKWLSIGAHVKISYSKTW